MTLEVDVDQLRGLGVELSALGDDLQACVIPMSPGPDSQPSGQAVNETGASVDHLTRIVGFRLRGWGHNYERAADAYDAADATGAGHLVKTMHPVR